MTGYDARKGVQAVVDMVNALRDSVNAYIASVPFTLNVVTRCSKANQTVPTNTGVAVLTDYEIGSGFVTELEGTDSLMEILL